MKSVCERKGIFECVCVLGCVKVHCCVCACVSMCVWVLCLYRRALGVCAMVRVCVISECKTWDEQILQLLKFWSWQPSTPPSIKVWDLIAWDLNPGLRIKSPKTRLALELNRVQKNWALVQLINSKHSLSWDRAFLNKPRSCPSLAALVVKWPLWQKLRRRN